MESKDFAKTLRNELTKFLAEHGDSRYEAARIIGLDHRRLNTYFLDDPKTGRPRIPNAEVLYLLCSRLGFVFEYEGFRICAETLDGMRVTHPGDQQLSFDFERQFSLTNDQGAVAVRIKRPSGRIELSVSLKAQSA